jgi:hypothetical protein
MKLFLRGMAPFLYIIVRCRRDENFRMGEEGSYQEAERAD